jgi:hypothetical protein
MDQILSLDENKLRNRLRSESLESLKAQAEKVKRIHNVYLDVIENYHESSFDKLPEEMIEQMCYAMDTVTLAKFTQSSGRHYKVCIDILENRISSEFDKEYSKVDKDKAFIFDKTFIDYLIGLSERENLPESLINGIATLRTMFRLSKIAILDNYKSYKEIPNIKILERYLQNRDIATFRSRVGMSHAPIVMAINNAIVKDPTIGQKKLYIRYRVEAERISKSDKL